jgi:hypothetical protein
LRNVASWSSILFARHDCVILKQSFNIFTTAEQTMNKKLISLAVAAALAAPAAAMAEATIYGKVSGQVTYEDVKNVIAPTFEFL